MKNYALSINGRITERFETKEEAETVANETKDFYRTEAKHGSFMQTSVCNKLVSKINVYDTGSRK